MAEADKVLFGYRDGQNEVKQWRREELRKRYPSVPSKDRDEVY